MCEVLQKYVGSMTAVSWSVAGMATTGIRVARMETCSCGGMFVCVTVLQFGDSLGVMCLQSSNG